MLNNFNEFMNENLHDKDVSEMLKLIVEHKITRIVFIEVIYQYRYNGINMEVECYSGEKEIDFDFSEEISAALMPLITEAGNLHGDGEMFGNIEICSSFSEVLSDDDTIEVETGTDS